MLGGPICGQFYLNRQVPKFPDSTKLFATGDHELDSLACGRVRPRFTRMGGAGRGTYLSDAGAGGAGAWGPEIPSVDHGLAISAVQPCWSSRAACSQGCVKGSG